MPGLMGDLYRELRLTRNFDLTRLRYSLTPETKRLVPRFPECICKEFLSGRRQIGRKSGTFLRDPRLHQEMLTRKLAFAATFVLILSACASPESVSDGPDVTENTTTTTTPNTDDTTRTDGGLLPAQEVPGHLQRVIGAWTTDFSKATVALDEILVGIPTSDPRDAIPPLDNPAFRPVSETSWIADREPGVFIEQEGDARFYPLSVMTRHEIVNDVIGGIPIAVTYCPLCNTAVGFDRRFEGQTLRLGVSGLLRNSDLVMWDDATQSLWQQVTGEAIVGEQAGKRLSLFPTAIIRWADFKENHPDGQALSDIQGFGIPYGRNPYEFYSTRDAPLSFFQGDIDPRYPALERVVGVTVGEASKAYAFSDIESVGVVNDTVGGQPIVVLWGAADTADGLDAGTISEARAIGTGLAYSSTLNGTSLTFERAGDDLFRDIETGTSWDILGLGVEGELAGERLELITHRNEFWFAWQAFFPDSEVWESTASTGRFAGAPMPDVVTVQFDADAAGSAARRPTRR